MQIDNHDFIARIALVTFSDLTASVTVRNFSVHSFPLQLQKSDASTIDFGTAFGSHRTLIPELAYDDSVSPMQEYHWAICRDGGGSLMVHEFWHPEVWTTERYRSSLGLPANTMWIGFEKNRLADD